MAKPLVRTLIDAGYEIAKITPATPMTAADVELSNGIDITFEHGLMQVGKELPSGIFKFMPIRKSVDEIMNDIKAMV